MNSVKTTRTYTVEELREKADLALNVPSLVEIVKNAPVAENGKINLTQVRDRAYQRAVEETHDLKDAKKLADSTRALAMLRQDHAEKFEKLVAQKKQLNPEIKSLEKFSEIKFDLTYEPIEITFTEKKRDGKSRGQWYTIKFVDYHDQFDEMREQRIRNAGIQFCLKILHALIKTADTKGNSDVMTDLIRLLEEKLVLRIRVCHFCKHLTDPLTPHCRYLQSLQNLYELKPYTGSALSQYDLLKNTCEHWEPKEVLEKLSSA